MDADSLSPVTGALDDPVTARTEAIEGLYRIHRVRLTRLARAITLDDDAAEEVMHEAFVGLQSHWDTITNPEGYLQRSVVNTAIKTIRRRRTASRYMWPATPITKIPEIDETWAAVVALAPRQRAVVVLRYWEDMSEADIAVTLGWRPGTVKSSLHRALAALRKEITP